MSLQKMGARRIVHYNQAVGLSALFRPLPKTVSSERPALDVTYPLITSGPYIHFSAKAALGIPEQTLLLVLIELAQEQFKKLALGVVINDETRSGVGRDLWNKLQQAENNCGGQTLRFETCFSELNRRCGSQTGGTSQVLRAAQLDRLCEVVVWECDGDDKITKRQSNLIIMQVGNDERLHLALNCRLASAVFGQPYSQVSLSERLSLKRDVSKAIHAFLSTTIAHGNRLKIGIEKLIERFWPENKVKAQASTHRSRRLAVREGLEAINMLVEWSVDWERIDLAVVRRHSPGVVEMTSHKGNKNMAYRQQALPLIINKNNNLAAFDVSGLFLNKKSA